MKSEPVILLSDIIVTPLELGKVQRELFALDEFLSADSHGKSSGSSLPYTSPLLSNMLKSSGLNILKPQERDQFTKQLDFVRRTAPVVHMSFGSEPTKQALRVLVRWFRENGHPNTLINPAVSPKIAGGCILRTSTKTFDFSLQKLFNQSVSDLAQKLT
jgi:F0F1-type ATP synthase delta subunit